MGGSGGDYSPDVNVVRKSSTTRGFSDTSREEFTSKSGPYKSVLPINFPGLEIYKDQDIVFVLIDGTGSMGDDVFIIRDKIVLLEGQLRIQGYLKDPLVVVGIVGDANSDNYPIQVSKPERGDALISEIGKLYVEHGGGGQSMESYELMAYYLLKHVKLNDPKNKPFVFWLGDEGVYPEISAEHINEHIKDETVEEDIDTKETFTKLCKKYNVYRLHREYNDKSENKNIMKQWRDLIGDERVQQLTKPKEVVDVILGVVATGTKSRSIGQYLDDMRQRGQTDDRIEDVEKMLLGFEKGLVPIADTPQNVAAKLPGADANTKKRSAGSKKL